VLVECETGMRYLEKVLDQVTVGESAEAVLLALAARNL